MNSSAAVVITCVGFSRLANDGECAWSRRWGFTNLIFEFVHVLERAAWVGMEQVLHQLVEAREAEGGLRGVPR